MRGRTLKHFFFLSELNECYVPGTVLNSLDRDEKTLWEEANDCTVLYNMSLRCCLSFYF